MAGKTDVWDALWEDEDFVTLCPEGKAIWFYLVTGTRAVSGIYARSLSLIEYKTKVPLEEVRRTLVENEIKNISYDEALGVVFVKNRLFYRSTGGNPELLALSIIGDWKITKRAVPFWQEFRAHYYAHADTGIDIKITRTMEHLREMAFLENAATTANPEKKKRSKTQTNGATVVEELLSRYARELDEEDYNYFLAQYRALFTNARTGAPLGIKTQLRFLEKAAKKPAAQVARAFFIFDEKGCAEERKGWEYLWGIVKGSAETWYLENIAAHEGEDSPHPLFGR